MACDVYEFLSVVSLMPDFSRILRSPYGNLSQPSSAPLPNGWQLLSPHREAWSDWEMSLSAACSHTSAILPQKPLCLLLSCQLLESLWKSVLKSRNCTEIPIVSVPPRNAKPPRQIAATLYRSDQFHPCSYFHLWRFFLLPAAKKRSCCGSLRSTSRDLSLPGC